MNYASVKNEWTNHSTLHSSSFNPFKDLANPKMEYRENYSSFKDLGNPRMEYRENYYVSQPNIYSTAANVSPDNSIFPKRPYISQVKDGHISLPQMVREYSFSDCS